MSFDFLDEDSVAVLLTLQCRVFPNKSRYPFNVKISLFVTYIFKNPIVL